MARYLAFACLALALVAIATVPIASAERSDGLLIIVTAPSLVDDVRSLASEDDAVQSIVPPNVDPHSYGLKPSDIDTLRRASIIVTLGHTPIDRRIEELASRGALKAVVISIPEVPNLTLLKVPGTHATNLHMPIYDPRNYEKFLRYLANEMARLRPSKRDVYVQHLEKLLEELRDIEESCPKLNIVAVASDPVLQYAVEWMGIHVEHVLCPEHGVPPTPSSVAKAEDILCRRHGVAVVSQPLTTASMKLLEIAKKCSAPIIYVPLPYQGTSLLKNLRYVVQQVQNLTIAERSISTNTNSSWNSIALPIALILVLIAAIIIVATKRFRAR